MSLVCIISWQQILLQIIIVLWQNVRMEQPCQQVVLFSILTRKVKEITKRWVAVHIFISDTFFSFANILLNKLKFPCFLHYQVLYISSCRKTNATLSYRMTNEGVLNGKLESNTLILVLLCPTTLFACKKVKFLSAQSSSVRHSHESEQTEKAWILHACTSWVRI
jgi:hypothetical protein